MNMDETWTEIVFSSKSFHSFEEAIMLETLLQFNNFIHWEMEVHGKIFPWNSLYLFLIYYGAKGSLLAKGEAFWKNNQLQGAICQVIFDAICKWKSSYLQG